MEPLTDTVCLRATGSVAVVVPILNCHVKLITMIFDFATVFCYVIRPQVQKAGFL